MQRELRIGDIVECDCTFYSNRGFILGEKYTVTDVRYVATSGFYILWFKEKPGWWGASMFKLYNEFLEQVKLATDEKL